MGKGENDMNTDQAVKEKEPNSGKKWILIIGAGLALICICLVIVGVIAVPSLLRMTESNISNYSGIASEQLKNDVLAAISESQGCSSVSLFSGQMMMAPEQSTDGSWIEIWQVLVCSESHMYSITFTPDGVGGTFFSAERMNE